MIDRLLHRLRGDRQVGWAFADQVVVSGANFATIMLLGRFLGASGLGVFALTWMVVLFAGSLQAALIVSPMMSLAPKRPADEADGYFAATWRGQLTLAGACGGVTALGASIVAWLLPDIATMALVAPLAIAVVTYQVQDFVRRYHFVRLRPRTGFLNDAGSFGIQLVALVVLGTVAVPHASLDPVTALWVVALAPIVPCVLATREIRGLEEDLVRNDGLFRSQWSYSKWQVGSAILSWVSGNFMVVMSGILLGPAAAGAMTAIRRIVNVSNVLLQSIENVVPTMCAMRLSAGGIPEFRAYFRQAMRSCVLVSTTFCLVVAAFAPFWLQVFAGPSFVMFAESLRLYAPYCVLVAIGLVLPAGLRTFEETRYMFQTSLVTAAVGAAVAWPFIGRWGIDGAIAGLLLTQLLTVVMYAIGLRRILRSYEGGVDASERVVRTASAVAVRTMARP